jgi:hypothetical protein
MNFFAALILALSLGTQARAEAPFIGGSQNISRNLIASSGAILSTTSFTLTDSIGENFASDLSGGSFKMQNGLMNIAPQPGTITSLVAQTKSTGTLELAWTSPGLDGFLGTVNGFYRIDTSSDPSHVFDPTIYTTEFSTISVPGTAQSYTLSNLQPNTTYYSRVYLADMRKAVSETSAEDRSSTS